MKYIKKYYPYILLFIGVFIGLEFLGFTHNYGDPNANYGFSYALINGEIPYKDFNIISTPLFMFYVAIGLKVFNSYIMILIMQSLLVTIVFSFIYKLFGKKSIILLLSTVIFQFVNIIPTYNFMCFAMMVILIYLENKHNDNDYLIGVFLALAILSKQTVGFFLIIPTFIFYFKDKKKILKRFIGFIIPMFIFLIYLIITDSLYSFMDLCCFGLFDFLSNNGVGGSKVDIIGLSTTIICFIVQLITLIKDKKNINNYYLISGVFFTIPLFDYAHIGMYINTVIITLIPYIKLNDKYLTRLTISISLVVETLIYIMWFSTINITFNKNIKHYELLINDKKYYKAELAMYKYFDRFKDPIIISYRSIKYNISRDRKLTYFDVPLYGNFGYGGSKKMINKIKRMHNQIFIVSMADYENKFKYSQFSKELAGYVIKTCKKIDDNKKYRFEVYYKE